MVAPTRSLTKYLATLQSLDSSGDQILLAYGPPGSGKTTAAGHSYVQQNGILLRCLTGSSQRALIFRLAKELSISLKNSTNGEMLEQLIDAISQNPRPIFIDEGDRLFERKALFESIRDIHDECRIPVVIMGASSSAGFVGVDSHVRKYPQLADRVSHWVKFEPADMTDLVALAGYYAPGLELTEGIQQRILKESQGNIRRIKFGLKRCVVLARRKKLTRVDEGAFGKSEAIALKAANE